MKISLLAYGTRGDVQPLAAIGLALQRRGHDVVVAAPHDHLGFLRRMDLHAMPLAGDSAQMLQTPHGRRWVERGDALSLLRAVLQTFREHAAQADLDVAAATAHADVVVTGLLIGGMGRLHADKRGVPHVMAHTFPGLPSTDVHNATVDLPLWLPGLVKRTSAALLSWVTWQFVRGLDDDARSRHGLPRATREPAISLHRRGLDSLHLWSPTLVGRPRDWGAHEHVVGFCALPSSARTSLGEDEATRALHAFLEAGPPPLYIGLGSMPMLDPLPTVRLFVDALARLGQRAVLGGTFPLDDDGQRALRALLPDAVRLVGHVDHDALFERCCAALHHGGAGTTAASLRAGLPTMVASVFGDQPFWGRVIARRGVGVTTPFRTLTSARLQRGLSTLLQPDVRARAAALGVALRAEGDGAARAADVLEEIHARRRVVVPM